MFELPTNGDGKAVESASSEEREELFPEEEGDVIDTMDVTKKIYAIRLIEREIEQYKRQDVESRSFYSRKVSRCDERIEFIKANILGFLRHHELTRLPTPSGTAYQKTVTTKRWPEDEVLLSWVRDHLPEAVRTKQEPDKKAISDHIKRTGEVPEGYEEMQETRLAIK